MRYFTNIVLALFLLVSVTACSEAEKALIAAIQEYEKKKILEDPMFKYTSTQGAEFTKRNDVVVVIFKSTKKDPDSVLAHFKLHMRTKDPNGFLNPYWVAGFLGESKSYKTGCGIIYAQWYAKNYPFSDEWETMMEKNAQYDGVAWAKVFAKDGKLVYFGEKSYFTEVLESCGSSV